MARDAAALHFDGHIVTGQYGRVSANLKTRQLFFRRKRLERPFHVITLPTLETGVDVLSEIFCVLALRGWADSEGMDDFTSVLWAFINVADLEKPIDLGSIALSKEAVELFEKQFPDSS